MIDHIRFIWCKGGDQFKFSTLGIFSQPDNAIAPDLVLILIP